MEKSSFLATFCLTGGLAVTLPVVVDRPEPSKTWTLLSRKVMETRMETRMEKSHQKSMTIAAKTAGMRIGLHCDHF